MNETTEANAHLFKLIQLLQKQVATLATKNNMTNLPITTNTRKLPNAPNPWNCYRHNTRKYCWSYVT